MDRREALKLLGLTSVAFISGCGTQITLDLLEETESAEYSRIRNGENERVQDILKYYAKGVDSATNESYDRLNIALMTDSHIDLGPIPKESKRNVKDSIEFCNLSSIPIAAILQGGDLVTQIMGTKAQHIEHLDEYFQLGWKATMPLLFTKGNHDINAINVAPSQVLTDDDWGKVWFDKAEQQYGIVRHIKADGKKSSYYYYDLEAWKVRIISLDCFDVDLSLTNEHGDVLYWARTSNYFANEQFNWVANSALNFDDKEEKGWGVILFTHFYRPSDIDGTSIEPVFESIYKKFNSMLLAFNKQSSFEENYTFPQNHYYDLSVSGDWSRYASLEKKPYLICVLSGHQHTDIYMDWWGAKHFVTANQFCGNEFSDERIIRTPGTSSQNLFDILNIDLRQKKIRIIRYGASANLDGLNGNRFLSDGLDF